MKAYGEGSVLVGAVERGHVSSIAGGGTARVLTADWFLRRRALAAEAADDWWTMRCSDGTAEPRWPVMWRATQGQNESNAKVCWIDAYGSHCVSANEAES